MYLNNLIRLLSINFFLIINLILFYFGLINFNGKIINFILLFLICNFYIFYSFKYSYLFLDKTLSTFFWLGFFYKLCIHLVYKYTFPEGGGAFGYQPNDYDNLLKFSYFGISSFLIGSILFNKIFPLKEYAFKKEQNILFNFYKKKKFILIIFFFILIILINSLNLFNGFYQKGLLPEKNLNFVLGSFIKWMLLFGLTSISCLLIEYDIKIYKKISLFVILLFFFELAFTNFTLLSRSLVFGGSAILFSTYINYGNIVIKKNFNNSLIVNSIILFLIFSVLIFPINKIRNAKYIDSNYIIEQKIIFNSKSIDVKEIEEIKEKEKLDLNENLERIIFVIKNRFVGLDAVAAVSSYPKKNYDLFFSAINEKFNPNLYGFYERTFIKPFENNLNNSNYIKSSKRQYGIILPGIISFLSYPGSILFLILSCFLIHFFCSIIEFCSRKFSYNSIIFSNFIGFVLGYRLIHFGYLPKQSYLIICAIFLTIFITFILKKLIINFYKI